MRLDEFVRTNKVDILSCWRSSRHDAGLAMDEVAERDTMAAAGEELDVLCEFVRAQDRGDLALDLRDAAQSWISGTATGKSVEQMLREAMMLGRSVRRMVEEKNTEVSCCEIGMFYEGIQELLLVQLTRAIKTEQMESRQKRAEYLAFLGHELAAPLHTIRLMLGLLERGGDEAEKARATMTRATDRLLELVQRVVDFEWLTLEELPLRLERIRPCSVLDTILESVDFLAWQKGLRLVTRVERTLTMYVDPRLLHDALGNLIRNAVNYCESGTITIGIQEVGSMVKFSVRDTGPGIPKERQEEIFQPFRRLDFKKAGTGLGLAIAKHAVEAMRGQISVESELGCGAHFTVMVPRELHL